jgi:hypothetical protein
VWSMLFLNDSLTSMVRPFWSVTEGSVTQGNYGKVVLTLYTRGLVARVRQRSISILW